MDYNILGISIHKEVRFTTGEPPKSVLESTRFRVFVAWQSNHPDFPFCWRCTTQTVDHLPTDKDIYDVAARGDDEMDRKLVWKLFPFLPSRRLTD